MHLAALQTSMSPLVFIFVYRGGLVRIDDNNHILLCNTRSLRLHRPALLDKAKQVVELRS